MKRLMCAVLAAVLLLSLPGCRSQEEDTVQFYYLRSSDAYRYGFEDAVIAPEIRENLLPGEELTYLLRLYLEGPVSEELHSPFPDALELTDAVLEENCLMITVSEEFSALEGIDMTLAGVCLSSTCFSLSDAESVQIVSGGKTWTYSRDSFILTDESAASPTE